MTKKVCARLDMVNSRVREREGALEQASISVMDEDTGPAKRSSVVKERIGQCRCMRGVGRNGMDSALVGENGVAVQGLA